ncbi:nicotinamidase-related amidase [Naumannella halotolerans]|uniref:Nicotinamidase-related amidase n=2 Tax=Naumannella halotolerans TaxID=993414 RepID=A0A4R7J709_9ACTN|nr:nicotinamidase-related amidase [Naumannella halotolerans]
MCPEETLANISRVVDWARVRADLIVWITHSEPNSGTVFDPARGFVQVVTELGPASAEPQVTKTSVNSFTTTCLQQLLVQRGIRRLVITGVRTEQCCETTARLASDLGFEVTFVLDATTTSDLVDDRYGIVGRTELIRRTGAILQQRGFAEVLNTEDLLRLEHGD